MSSSFKFGESIDGALSNDMFFRDEIYLVKNFLAHTSIILNHRKKQELEAIYRKGLYDYKVKDCFFMYLRSVQFSH